MSDMLTQFSNDPLVHEVVADLIAGEITLLTSVVWVAVAALFSIVGGAIGGILLAGNDLGYRLAAMIGGLFGPAAMIPAAIAGLVFLRFV